MEVSKRSKEEAAHMEAVETTITKYAVNDAKTIAEATRIIFGTSGENNAVDHRTN